MTRLHVIQASCAHTAQAVAALDAQWQTLTTARPALTTQHIKLAVAFYGCEHDDRQLHHYVSTRFEHAALIGGSSAGGLMTHHGVLGPEGIGLMLVEDAHGDYGAASAALDDDPAGLAESLLQAALRNSGCEGEIPELIWIYQCPGTEERVLEGLRRVVGSQCVIVGGSSGDNTISGQWRQLGPQGPMSHGLAVAVLSPSSPISAAFQGGYVPTGIQGIATEVRGPHRRGYGRRILSIDGQPAAQVYNRWTQGLIDAQLHGGQILVPTVSHPLAVQGSPADDIEHYRLIHPAEVHADGSLSTFCEVEQGTTLHAMQGNREQLIERAGKVLQGAHRAMMSHPLAGALVTYCGGCKLAVGDEMSAVSNALRDAAGEAPFITCFTFGEQGQLLQHNVHGNLMVGAIAFGQ